MAIKPSDLYTLLDQPDLNQPVLLVATEGWIDAGLGGAGALGALLNAISTEVVATFDTDRLIDYRSRRPVSHMVDGVYDNLVWPELELRAGQDGQGNGILFLVGPEPDHQWRTFAAATAEIGDIFGVRMVVGMGAFFAPVPHTRGGRLAATASSAELASQIGVVNGTVAVPSGVLAAIERSFADRGVPGIGIWARVPHYVTNVPYPEASVLLLEGLAQVTGISVDSPELRQAAEVTRQQLDGLVANSAEHTALVRQLEAQFDADPQKDAGEETFGRWANLGSSGEDLVAEVERFLRDEGQSD